MAFNREKYFFNNKGYYIYIINLFLLTFMKNVTKSTQKN